MKFDCEKCGKIDVAELDGYAFSERIFEGVIFIVRKNDDGTCEVSPKDKNDVKGYEWNGYWKEIAETFASKYDVFTCPACGGDVIPDDMME